MKNNLIVCSLMMIPAMSMAAEFSIASPDGKTVVEVNDNNGQPAMQFRLMANHSSLPLHLASGRILAIIQKICI